MMWLPVGLLDGVIRWLRAPPYDVVIDGRLERVPVGPFLLSSAIVWTVCVGIGGLLFALVLRWVAAGRPVGQLSVRAVAIWGAVVGVSFPAVFLTRLIFFEPRTRWIALAMLATAAVVGAVSAGSMIRWAQQGERPTAS